MTVTVKQSERGGESKKKTEIEGVNGRESWHNYEATTASRLSLFSITASDSTTTFSYFTDKETENKRKHARERKKERKSKKDVKDQEASRHNYRLGGKRRSHALNYFKDREEEVSSDSSLPVCAMCF